MTHSPRRRRVFTVVAMAIPIAVFLLAESTLWVLGVGETPPLFVPVMDHPDYLVPNPEVGQRYFSGTSVVPGPPHDAFLAVKPANGLRLVVQGGSSAAGFPYGHGGAFPRMLEQRLAQTFPGRSVEVVNTGMDAVSSWTLLDLQEEIIGIHPDAVLIYAGHNEYYGALGVASTERLGGRFATRLYMALDGFRVVRALSGAWARVLGPDPVAAGDQSLMQDLAAGREVVFGGDLYERGIQQARINFERLACRYRDLGIPVLLSTVASNARDQKPFGGGGVSGLSGLESVSDADSASFRQQLEGMVAADSTAAGPLFSLARFFHERGDAPAAGPLFLQARDRDLFPFRAPSYINTALRQVADACGAILVDAESEFAAASPGGVPGSELFLEHLHPNVSGYFLLSDGFYRALKASSIPEAWTGGVPPQAARRELLVTEFDTLLAAVHVRRLTTRWPFDSSQATDTLRMQGLPGTLVGEFLRGQRTWFDATATLGSWYESQGNLAEALRAGLALMQERPYAPGPYEVVGSIMARGGRLEEALDMYRRARGRGAGANAVRMSGQLLVRLGRAAEGLRDLEEARRLAPGDADVLFDLGVGLLTSGHHERASNAAREVLRLQPNHEGARRLLERAVAASSAQ